MNLSHLKKTDFYILGWGAVFIAGAFFFGRMPIILGVVFGVALSYVDWLATRYVTLRIAAASDKRRFQVFLAVKMMLVATIAGAVLLFAKKMGNNEGAESLINPIAAGIGWSSMMLGIFTHSFRQSLSAGDAALKEEL